MKMKIYLVSIACVKLVLFENNSLMRNFGSILEKRTISYFSKEWHQNDELGLGMI